MPIDRQTVKAGPKRRRKTRRELPHGQITRWPREFDTCGRVRYPIVDPDDLGVTASPDEPDSYWYDPAYQEVWDDYTDGLAEQEAYSAAMMAEAREMYWAREDSEWDD